MNVGCPLYNCSKPLAIIWKLFPNYTEKNTLMVDDIRENCELNMRNSYIIADYNRCWEENLQIQQDSESGDKRLLWLKFYLLLVKDEIDLRDNDMTQYHMCDQELMIKEFVRKRASELSQVSEEWSAISGMLAEIREYYGPNPYAQWAWNLLWRSDKSNSKLVSMMQNESYLGEGWCKNTVSHGAFVDRKRVASPHCYA